MKEKGIIKEDSREMLQELQVLNVPVEKLDEAVHVMTRGFGLNVVDSISVRSGS